MTTRLQPAVEHHRNDYDTATGRPIQKVQFRRMPKPRCSFNLANSELVTAERIDVGRPAPGKFVAPVDVSVSLNRKHDESAHVRLSEPVSARVVWRSAGRSRLRSRPTSPLIST